MNFVILKKKKKFKDKIHVKNELFQSSVTKNELFKVQGQKRNSMENLETKTFV